MAYRRRRRYRYNQRKREELDLEKVFVLLAGLVILAVLYNLYIFVKTNWVGVLIAVVIIAVVAGLGIYLFFHLKAKKEKIKLEDIKNSQIVLKDKHEENKTEKTDLLIKTKNLIESFDLDIPRGVEYKESDYQKCLGKFLISKLPQHSVKYERQINKTRPDIAIDGNEIAIEVKAMRNTKNMQNKRNKEYNDKHITSIYEKKHNYNRNFKEVIFVIFNSRFVNNKTWEKYKEAKKMVGYYWIEK